MEYEMDPKMGKQLIFSLLLLSNTRSLSDTELILQQTIPNVFKVSRSAAVENIPLYIKNFLKY